MTELLHGSLISYEFDKKNSVKGERQSYDYPGHEREIALIIYSIEVEAKTSVLKTLKVGDAFEFAIKEDVDVPNPNFKQDGEETISVYCEGTGGGEIKSISEIDLNLNDDEYQYVTIHFTKGSAEGL